MQSASKAVKNVVQPRPAAKELKGTILQRLQGRDALAPLPVDLHARPVLEGKFGRGGHQAVQEEVVAAPDEPVPGRPTDQLLRPEPVLRQPINQPDDRRAQAATIVHTY